MDRHELTDEQWARVEPLLPPLRSGRPGRPYHDHRRIINGLLFLASDRAGNVTGADFVIDGGLITTL